MSASVKLNELVNHSSVDRDLNNLPDISHLARTKEFTGSVPFSAQMVGFLPLPTPYVLRQEGVRGHEKNFAHLDLFRRFPFVGDAFDETCNLLTLIHSIKKLHPRLLTIKEHPTRCSTHQHTPACTHQQQW